MTIAVGDEVWVVSVYGPYRAKVVALGEKPHVCVCSEKKLEVVDLAKVYKNGADCHEAMAHECFQVASEKMAAGMKWQEQAAKLREKPPVTELPNQ
jgi:hypothetical protein